MKNLYKFSSLKKDHFILILFLLTNLVAFSQEIVSWSAHPSTTTFVNGTTTSAITVTASRAGANTNLTFFANNTASNTLNVRGPWPQVAFAAADDLVFNFSKPVIITELFVTDINTNAGNPGWNDSFEFDNSAHNFTFTAFTSPYTSAPIQTHLLSNTGIKLITGSFPNVNNATWFCSTPVAVDDDFRLHFSFIDNRTTAFLDYRMWIIEIPILDPICLNNVAPNLPVIGNNILGTWNPQTIDTSIAGNFIYTFTPNSGQALTCPIPIEVTILPANDSNCCQNNLNLINPLNNVSNLSLPVNGARQREALNWITATNIVTVGDNSFENGVVYHAGDYVELNPGFEAVFGSQFSVYIKSCSASYAYRKAAIQSTKSDDAFQFKNIKKVKGFNIIPNPSNSSIELTLANRSIREVEIQTIYGKTVFEKTIANQESVQIDISSYENGLYMVSVLTQDGEFLSEKLIKN